MKHYEKYRSDEEKDYFPFVWIFSAISRGLRDAPSGEVGIVYRPGLLNHQNNTYDKEEEEEDGDDVSVYGDEGKLEQSIFDLMKELHEDTFTPIMKMDNEHDDTFKIVSMETSPDVDMEDMAVTPNKESVVSEDSTESCRTDYVMEEEDSSLAVSSNSNDPKLFDNEVSDVDSVSLVVMSIFTLLS